MLRVSLEQWRMFKLVAEHGGFTQASQVIHKSQSSIHNSVNKLESTLDVRLFKVEGRKTLLTSAGEILLRRARFLLEEASRVEAIGKTLADGIEITLKIVVDEIFSHDILFEALERTSAAYPMLRIELFESILAGAKESLEKGIADIAISPFIICDVFSEELCQIEFSAVASPNHSLFKIKRPLTTEDLKSYRQIVVRDSASLNRCDDGWLGANQRWTVSHMGTSIKLIKKGLGFAWLPMSNIESDMQTHALKMLHLQSGGTRKVTLHLLYLDADKLGPAARAFINELRLLII